MLFEELKGIKYRKYTSDITEVTRHINLRKTTAEEVNKVIAVVNKDNKNFKINNSILFNIAIKKLLDELEELPTEEAIQVLLKEALAEVEL